MAGKTKEDYEAVFRKLNDNLTKNLDIDEEYEQEVIGQMDDGTAVSYAKGASKKDTSVNSKKCGTNEELGADKVTCVCKWGYTKVNGNCVQEKEESTTVSEKINESSAASTKIQSDSKTDENDNSDNSNNSNSDNSDDKKTQENPPSDDDEE